MHSKGELIQNLTEALNKEVETNIELILKNDENESKIKDLENKLHETVAQQPTPPIKTEIEEEKIIEVN